MSGTSDNFTIGGALVALLVLALLLLHVLVQATTYSSCLKRGYPGATVDWRFNRYCIARVNQTDLVIPYERASERPVQNLRDQR